MTKLCLSQKYNSGLISTKSINIIIHLNRFKGKITSTDVKCLIKFNIHS